MTGYRRRDSRALRPAMAVTAGLAGLALHFGCATAVADDSTGAETSSSPARTVRTAAVHRTEQPRSAVHRSTVAALRRPQVSRTAPPTTPSPAAGSTLTDLMAGALQARNAAAENRRSGPTFGRVPRYDHVVVVVLENHSFDQIRGLADTNQPPVPYINNTLVPGGALMTAAYGLQHPSQPNYYWLFSGNNQGVTTDAAPYLNGLNTINSTARNLYTELQALRSPKTFTGYVEGYTGPADLVAGGFTFTGSIASADQSGLLENVVRHMPWAGFANVPTDVTTGFQTLANIDYSALPDVSFVIPALQHDMHNWDYGSQEVADIRTSDIAMSNADTWLQENIDGYAQWALTHNSLLIITTDEDSTPDWITPPLPAMNYSGPDGYLAVTPIGAPGFTSALEGPSPTANNPSGAGQSGPNPIFTLFYGARVVPGEYSNPITNVNVLRTVEAAMGVRTKAGAQPEFVGRDGDGNRVPGFRFNNRAVKGIFSLR